MRLKAMVPKVAGKGASFRGAGLYYLHDKKAATSERVAFTHTENLPTADPALALKCMAYTAMRQDEIKAACGGSRTGRKLTQPVYTYSLSWAPGEEPTQEQMLEAGRESVRTLGLENHEMLMIAHTDQAHPHLHVIVNRVHPETGIAAKLSKDHLALSRWAERYEREQGKIRCEQRVANNAARRKGAFRKAARGITPSDLRRWRRQRLERAHHVRQAAARNLSAHQLGQKQALQDQHRNEKHALYKQKEAEIRQILSQSRVQNRSRWAELYQRQRNEWRALNTAQENAYTRLRYHLESRGDDPRRRTKGGIRQLIADAAQAVFGRDNPHGTLSKKHRADRAKLASDIREQNGAALRVVNQRYRQALSQLKRRQEEERRAQQNTQKHERHAQQQEHSRQSQDYARDIKSGRDAQLFRKEAGQSVSDDFARRVRQQMEQAKKRRAKDRRRGRDGGRERDS